MATHMLKLARTSIAVHYLLLNFQERQILSNAMHSFLERRANSITVAGSPVLQSEPSTAFDIIPRNHPDILLKRKACR